MAKKSPSAAAPAAFRLDILGEFRLAASSGEAVRLTGKGQKALLAVLALAPGDMPREQLASLLWHDRGDEQARHSLRQAILTLRKALGDRDETILTGDSRHLKLNTERVAVDALEFESLTRGDSRDAMRRAASLYRGELLADLSVRSEAFEEWLSAERARWRDAASSLLLKLSEGLLADGAAEEAAATARRAIGINPLDEAAYRTLMRALALGGNRAAALSAYRSLSDVLKKELGAAPDPATARLAETLRSPSAPAERPIQAKAAPPRPGVVVLPFQSVDRDTARDPLAEALTEDIAAGLSAVSTMVVVAPSALPSEPATLAGPRHVLEGKVQRVDGQVRIWVRLGDRTEGRQIWAERFTGALSDVLALQDRITLEVVTALQVEITEGEQERIAVSRGTRNLEAWLAAGQGHQLLRRVSRSNTERARELYRRASERDANYAAAWEGLAWTHVLSLLFGWSADRAHDLAEAEALARKASGLDAARGRTHSLLGSIALMRGDGLEAIAAGEQALGASPQDAEATALLAYTLSHCGDLARAATLAETAIGLSPYAPRWYHWTRARIGRLSGRIDEAIAILSEHLDERPESLAPCVELALALQASGRNAEAQAVAKDMLRIDPTFRVSRWAFLWPDQDSARKDRDAALLRQAGLPD